MYKQQIIDTVNAIMARKADVDISEIKPDDCYDELGADSMQCMEALVEIEEEFAIDIPGSKLLHANTMQDVYDIVGQTIVDTHGFQLY